MRHFLQVLEYRLGKIVVLELHERVDEFNAKVLSEELKTILNTGRKKIIIELSKCTYLSASCLATLWKRQREARREGGDLVLVAASGKVLETIHSVNLDRVIRRYYTLPEASLGLQEEQLEKFRKEVANLNNERVILTNQKAQLISQRDQLSQQKSIHLFVPCQPSQTCPEGLKCAISSQSLYSF